LEYGDFGVAAQGFIAFAPLGDGMFIGSWISGKVVDAFSVAAPGTGHMWDRIWLVSAAGQKGDRRSAGHSLHSADCQTQFCGMRTDNIRTSKRGF
jgi:hypothetical protein